MKILKHADKKNISALSPLNGLSLIELLVVLVIIAILFGLGFANYRDYARKQTVSAAARQVESDVRLARQMAFEGKKPEGCGDLDFLRGYEFRVNVDNTYDIVAVCNDALVIPVKANVELASGGLTMVTDPPSLNRILFKSVGDGIEIPGGGEFDDNIEVQITQDATGYNAELIIGTSVKVTPSY